MDLIDWNIFGGLCKTVVSSLHPGSFNQEDDETVDDEHFHPGMTSRPCVTTAAVIGQRPEWSAVIGRRTENAGMWQK